MRDDVAEAEEVALFNEVSDLGRDHGFPGGIGGADFGEDIFGVDGEAMLVEAVEFLDAEV